MDLTWLRTNLGVARKYGEKWSDSIKYLLLVYSNKGPLHKLTGDKDFLMSFLFKEPIGRIRLKLRNNKGADSFIFSELFLHNYYDMKTIGRPRNILDLGANIGLTTIFWSKVYPEAELACVEPMPNNLEVLKWNVAGNGVKVTVIEGAVAVTDGDIFMEVHEKDFGHQVAIGATAGKNTIRVNAYSMPTILRRLGWPAIDLLKIDIEGYEAYLLKENCEWLYQVNHMIIELHEAYLVGELERLAVKYGFTKPVEYTVFGICAVLKSKLMKIFLSFFQGKPGHPIPAYGFWEYYIKQGIAESGHEWSECADVDWAYGLVGQSRESFLQWKTVAWEKTIGFLRSNPVDLFLSYLYPSQVDVSAIAEIRKMGIPCVNFFCDNIRTFRKIPREYRAFDLNWVPEYNAIQLYKQAGIPFIHLPMPMWVLPEHRVLKDEKLDQISFIGSADIQRILLLEDIFTKDPGLPLAIYGEGWRNDPAGERGARRTAAQYSLSERIGFQRAFIDSHGLSGWFRWLRQRKNNIAPSLRLQAHLRTKPDFQEYIRLSQESRVTMGINRYPGFRFPLDRPDSYSRLRDIEAPMLGCCYLTEWANGLDQMYDIGKDIFVYRSPEDFIVQYKILIADTDLRKTLRKNGQSRSLQSHSIPNTLNAIFNTL